MLRRLDRLAAPRPARHAWAEPLAARAEALAADRVAVNSDGSLCADDASLGLLYDPDGTLKPEPIGDLAWDIDVRWNTLPVTALGDVTGFWLARTVDADREWAGGAGPRRRWLAALRGLVPGDRRDGAADADSGDAEDSGTDSDALEYPVCDPQFHDYPWGWGYVATMSVERCDIEYEFVVTRIFENEFFAELDPEHDLGDEPQMRVVLPTDMAANVRLPELGDAIISMGGPAMTSRAISGSPRPWVSSSMRAARHYAQLCGLAYGASRPA